MTRPIGIVGEIEVRPARAAGRWRVVRGVELFRSELPEIEFLLAEATTEEAARAAARLLAIDDGPDWRDRVG